jgi:hypothetical protein
VVGRVENGEAVHFSGPESIEQTAADEFGCSLAKRELVIPSVSPQRLDGIGLQD